MADLPIACTLTGDAFRTRRQGLLGLSRRAEALELTPDGIRLQFGATRDALEAIVDAVDAERECCRFLRFDITVPPDGGPIALVLTGPSGTREFFTDLFQL